MLFGPEKKPYVAKRFYAVREGEHTVSFEENKLGLFHDVRYISIGKMALKDFYKHAEKTGTEVAQGTLLKFSGYIFGINILLDFAFTEALLAAEVIPADGVPSQASGVSATAYQNAVAESPGSPGLIVWMLEPLRSSHVDKWSGTMQHSRAIDKVHQTVNCFVHFVYSWTKETVVFADMQSEFMGLLSSMHI